MTLSQARNILNWATRQELRDHAFGDREIAWFIDGYCVGDGYQGGSGVSVSVHDGEEWHRFVDADAFQLVNCGQLGEVERNDETGPAEFSQNEIMPGLTLESVKQEICQKN